MVMAASISISSTAAMAVTVSKAPSRLRAPLQAVVMAVHQAAMVVMALCQLTALSPVTVPASRPVAVVVALFLVQVGRAAAMELTSFPMRAAPSILMNLALAI